MNLELNNQINILQVATKVYDGQKPGTSGLRKKVHEFQKQHYIENFIQSYFSALRKDALSPKCTLLVGGDGRYYSKEAISTVCRIACANGVDELHIAKDGLMSTPACSAYIRVLNQKYGNCLGGILLTASHNPGGPDQDFGVKFNSRNGGPAQEQFTNSVFQETKKISDYHISDFRFLKGESQNSPIDLSVTGEYCFTNVKRPQKNTFIVKVVQNVQNYVDLMKDQFDFQVIRKLFLRGDFKFVFDGMYGVAGPYAKALFEKEIKSQNITLLNCQPKDDFNKGHPDPNLKCAHQLVELMGLGEKKESQYSLGAACDGDADRNMIIGNCFFVTPSDSLAVLTANSSLFLKAKLHGVARSMPTSGAVDKVAKKLGIKLYQTPTGWKFFGNLMESDLITICGEQSFGTGSNHVREKDGLWTILAWLNILAKVNESTEIGKLKTVQNIVEQLWSTYGRNYYCRYDFENCDSEKGKKVWQNLLAEVSNYKQGNIKADVFSYEDPVDKSKSQNQGIRFNYDDGSRVVFRQSGTGSVGMTIRIYFEKYEEKDVLQNQFVALKEMIEFGLKISKVSDLTGKNEPDVIT